MSSRLGSIPGRNPMALYSWECDNVFPRLHSGNSFLDFISTLTYLPSLWESGAFFSLLFFSLLTSYIMEFKKSLAKAFLHFELNVRILLGGGAFSMCYYPNRRARHQATGSHTTHHWGLGRILKGQGDFSASLLPLKKEADASEEIRVSTCGQS